MTSSSSPDSAETPNAEARGRWVDLVRGRYGLYTLAINLGVLMWAMNQLVVAGVMPTVVADIGGLRLYSWTFALFSVGSVIGAASAGALRDAFGARGAYAGAGVLFLVGLIGSALAPNMETLVATRFVQGLGGGAVTSQGYALMASLYPERLRSRILAFTSTTWGVATAVGPGFGGVFAEFGLWREAFWSLAPFSIVFAVLAFRMIPTSDAHRRLSRIPYWRLALVGGSVLALSATSQADSTPARALFIMLSIALAVATFRRDVRAQRPMFPRAALRIGTEIGALTWMMLLMSATVAIYSTYQTLQLQVLHGVGPLIAAYIFMLSSFTWSCTSILVAPLTGRNETIAMFAGCVTLIVGTVGQAVTVVAGPVIANAAFISISGGGIGMMTNLLIQRTIRVADADEKAIAGASVQAIRTLGVAFGSAAAGTIAVAAGLTADNAGREVVAEAMRWVYGFDAAVAVTVLLIGVQMLKVARRTPSHSRS